MSKLGDTPAYVSLMGLEPEGSKSTPQGDSCKPSPKNADIELQKQIPPPIQLDNAKFVQDDLNKPRKGDFCEDNTPQAIKASVWDIQPAGNEFNTVQQEDSSINILQLQNE